MAMKRLKTSDLEDIRPRETIVMYIAQDGYKPNVLHIVKRQGYQETKGVIQSKRSVNITQCNRPLEYASPYSKTALPDDKLFWKLCPHCGTAEDFQAALNEYHTWWKEWNAKQKAEEQQKREAARREWERQLANLKNAAELLKESNLFHEVTFDENNGIVIKLDEYPQNWLQVTTYRDQ